MRESLKRSLLVVASILVGLMAGEIGTRASTWVYLFTWPNFVLDARTVLARQDSGRYVHDDRLGYVPRAGYAAPGLTIDSDGLRPTGEQTGPRQGAPILAVGDSFTFGDEVNDGQTWPAQLQHLTGRRVLNGGVSGYGFDQTVLRAEQLAPPDTSRRPSSSASSPTTSAAPRCAACGAPTSPGSSSTRTSLCCAACRCRRAPIRAPR